MRLQNRYFKAIKNGDKKVEGRLGNKADGLKVGDTLRFINTNTGETFNTTITGLNKYPTFREMLSTEGLENVLPGVESIEEGVRIYLKPTGFYSVEDEKAQGVVAIRIKIE